MPLVRLLLLGFALSGLWTGAASAQDRPVIKWLLTSAPPKMILSGPLRGKGYAEQQAIWLIKRLPQFDQRIEMVTAARLWHEMQNGQGICSIDIADLPEREAWALFTRHTTSVPGYSLLVLRERLAEFAPFRGPDGAIDLDRLAENGQLTGLYTAKRFYTPQINAFIDSPTRKTHLESTSASTKLFEMIASRRGDFSFGLGVEMNYFNALNEATGESAKRWPPLAMLTIKGGADMLHGHIACSRDPLGKKMIQALDRLFEDENAWNEFFAPHRRWVEGAEP